MLDKPSVVRGASKLAEGLRVVVYIACVSYRTATLFQMLLEQQIVSGTNMIVLVSIHALMGIFDVDTISVQLLQYVYVDRGRVNPHHRSW